MEKQYIGSEAPISKQGPREVEPDNRKTMQEQLLGSRAPLNTTPEGIPTFETPNRGTFQLTGEQVDLNKAAHHGWDSYDTPMSKRAIRQSEK